MKQKKFTKLFSITTNLNYEDARQFISVTNENRLSTSRALSFLIYDFMNNKTDEEKIDILTKGHEIEKNIINSKSIQKGSDCEN